MNFKANDFLSQEVPDDLTVDETLKFVYSLDWWQRMCAHYYPRKPFVQFWSVGVIMSGTVTMGEWRAMRDPVMVLGLTSEEEYPDGQISTWLDRQ